VGVVGDGGSHSDGDGSDDGRTSGGRGGGGGRGSSGSGRGRTPRRAERDSGLGSLLTLVSRRFGLGSRQ
jgi:hypothetical protein